MDRFQYCVLEFWPCCQCFTITRAGGDRCTAEFRLDLSALGQPRPSWPRRQVHFVRFAPKAAVADQSVIRWLVPQPSRLSARQVWCRDGRAPIPCKPLVAEASSNDRLNRRSLKRAVALGAFGLWQRSENPRPRYSPPASL